jgi:hypothetical protein
MTQENDKKIDARYQSIAYQLAKRISGGELYEGLKLSGRTLLASEYEGVFVQNPEASVILKPGMTLSLLGGPLEKDHVERFFKGEPHES